MRYVFCWSLPVSVYSERKTTKKGVNKSFMPWTYPVPGWRTAQTYKTL